MNATTTREITNSDDVIDVRDVIARYEYLENSRGQAIEEADTDLLNEFDMLDTLLEDLEGNGGDEEWRGSWYPITLVRESHFKDYAENLADELGYMDKNTTWPYNHIDWEAAANELLIDYTSTEFDGVTYYYR